MLLLDTSHGMRSFHFVWIIFVIFGNRRLSVVAILFIAGWPCARGRWGCSRVASIISFYYRRKLLPTEYTDGFLNTPRYFSVCVSLNTPKFSRTFLLFAVFVGMKLKVCRKILFFLPDCFFQNTLAVGCCFGCNWPFPWVCFQHQLLKSFASNCWLVHLVVTDFRELVDIV